MEFEKELNPKLYNFTLNYCVVGRAPTHSWSTPVYMLGTKHNKLHRILPNTI